MRRARFTPYGLLAVATSAWGLEFTLGASPEASGFSQMGTVAVVDISGPLSHHQGWCWDSYDSIRGRVAAAFASQCSAVVLRIDSPGGDVAGCFELSQELRKMAAASGKQFVAYADGQASSAAYALACAASAIYVPPTGFVGSIGCIKVVADQTEMDRRYGLNVAVIASGKRKADGNPHVPLSEDAIANFQQETDSLAQLFFGLVSQARGLPIAKIEAFEGAQFHGQAAVVAGLADAVMTFDGVLALVTSGKAPDRGEEQAMDYKEIVAALKAAAEGDDEEESKKAKAALKAMGEGDESEESEEDKKKKDDEAKAKAAADEEEKKDEEEKAKAAAAANPVLALGATVQSLTARIDAKDQAEERAKLMASRPDFDESVVKALATQSLDIVKFAVATYPKGKVKAPSQVAAALAAVGAQATRGESQGDTDGLVRGDYTAHDLDVQMGLAVPTHAIKHDGTRMSLGVMTPDQARAVMAERAKKEGK